MVHSQLVTYFSMISLLTLCPPFVILLWYAMIHADGSISETFQYLKQNGLQGFLSIWPRATVVAWKIIASYAAFEAALQLLLRGKRVDGPISPQGNRPVFKANGVAAYVVTLVTYVGLWEIKERRTGKREFLRRGARQLKLDNNHGSVL